MGGVRRIALIGFTGVGKSTVAEHLRSAHGFHIVSTGAMCRAVSRLVFGNEDKSNLIALTNALQSLDPAIFLKAALRDVPVEEELVIDALRYMHDHDYALEQGFHLIRLSAPLELRRQWLEIRGQRFDFQTDAKHASEIQLSDVRAGARIKCSGNPMRNEMSCPSRIHY